MLIINQFKEEDVLQQNCRIGRVYASCVAGKLCDPQGEFDVIERCKICNKLN